MLLNLQIDHNLSNHLLMSKIEYLRDFIHKKIYGKIELTRMYDSESYLKKKKHKN